jgi:multisubunit Na+/H+ antiporter MnhB subunit
MTEWLFDGLLAASLLWLSWRLVADPDLFRAVMLFIVFGLLMTLCWMRLSAPDVALAEAAIGTGLTGALLLDAWRVFGSQPEDGLGRAPSLLPMLLCAGLTAGLAWVLVDLPEPVAELTALVQTHLGESGVSNPVTAVLLNFRGYDTLLEMAVLLAALLGIWTVNPVTSLPLHSSFDRESTLVTSFIRLLVPTATLIASYLLWAGAHAPGGAFQAGAVLAAIGILLRLTGYLSPHPVARPAMRIGLVAGIATFVSIAMGGMAWGLNFLEYPKSWAGILILIIEASLTLSIAVTLTLLFSGAPGLRRWFR